MPLSPELIDQILIRESRRLGPLGRGSWPRYLFHSTNVDNAVNIVNKGALFSRKTCPVEFTDIANAGALANNDEPQDYARLYFRPKHKFHIATEGIKGLKDRYWRADQAAIPVMLLFDARSVLSMPGIQFSKGNIQRGSEWNLATEEEFKALDFNSIYHDSAVNLENRDRIQNARMAEVMVPDSIPLKPHLKGLVFRTPWELETFEYLCAQAGVACGFPKKVEEIGFSIFMRWGLYITDLTHISDRLTLEFHLPTTHKQETYKLIVQQFGEGTRSCEYNAPLNTSRRVKIRNYRNIPNSVWRIELEDQLAFQGVIRSDESTLG